MRVACRSRASGSKLRIIVTPSARGAFPHTSPVTCGWRALAAGMLLSLTSRRTAPVTCANTLHRVKGLVKGQSLGGQPLTWPAACTRTLAGLQNDETTNLDEMASEGPSQRSAIDRLKALPGRYSIDYSSTDPDNVRHGT